MPLSPGNRIARCMACICRASAQQQPCQRPQITAMLKEQMRTQDIEARKKILFACSAISPSSSTMLPHCVGITASWQQYVKNYAPNLSFDYGNRAAALWLER